MLHPLPVPTSTGPLKQWPARYATLSGAVQLWLNSGMPATEVARRAGRGVAVLLKIYDHGIDRQADAADQRITDTLGTQDAGQDPGDEGDEDSRAGILKCQVRDEKPGGWSA